MKYIATFLLLFLTPYAKSALTDGDFSHLSPADVGLSKIDIICTNPDAALSLEYKIHINGKLKLHYFVFQRQKPKSEMIMIYGTPIWGDQFIMKLANGINEKMGDYRLTAMSRGGWRFKFDFKNKSGDKMEYLLVFREVPIVELKNNKHIPEDFYLSDTWGASYPVDGENGN